MKLGYVLLELLIVLISLLGVVSPAVVEAKAIIETDDDGCCPRNPCCNGGPPTEDPRTETTIVVQTGTQTVAGTMSLVNISVLDLGQKVQGGNVLVTLLEKVRGTRTIFSRGHKDTFTRRVVISSMLSHLYIDHDGSGKSPDWFVDWVSVTTAEFTKTYWCRGFVIQNVKQICHVMEPKYTHNIAVYTGHMHGAGTGGKIYFNMIFNTKGLHTKVAESGLIHLSKKKTQDTSKAVFQRSATDIFIKIETHEYDRIKYVNVSNDDGQGGYRDPWYLKHFWIRRGGIDIEFRCDCWINLERTVYPIGPEEETQCTNVILKLKRNSIIDSKLYSADETTKSLETAYGTGAQSIVNLYLVTDKKELYFTIVKKMTRRHSDIWQDLGRKVERGEFRVKISRNYVVVVVANNTEIIGSCSKSPRRFLYCPLNTQKEVMTGLLTVTQCMAKCNVKGQQPCMGVKVWDPSVKTSKCTTFKRKNNVFNEFKCITDKDSIFALPITWCRETENSFRIERNDLGIYTYSPDAMTKIDAAQYCKNMDARLLDFKSAGHADDLTAYLNTKGIEIARRVNRKGFWVGASQKATQKDGEGWEYDTKGTKARPIDKFTFGVKFGEPNGGNRENDMAVNVENTGNGWKIYVADASKEERKHALCICFIPWKYPYNDLKWPKAITW